jgi:hypothetical protein
MKGRIHVLNQRELEGRVIRNARRILIGTQKQRDDVIKMNIDKIGMWIGFI